jgi:hypothetical protein
MKRLILAAALALTLSGELPAEPTWTPPADVLATMIRETLAAQEACAPLMPVATENGIECREPMDGWTPFDLQEGDDR